MLEAIRTETTFQHAAIVRELAQRRFHRFAIEAESLGRFARRKWAVGARIAANKFEHGMSNRFEQRGCNSGWQRNAQSIAIARRIFDGDHALFAADAQLKQATCAYEAIDIDEQILG